MSRLSSRFTVPNILSGYRILIFPFIVFLLISKNQELFTIFLIISLITDILDGLIARLFHMQTEFGARLDSIADLGTYILAIAGIFIFKYDDFQPHLFSFGLFIGLFALANLLSLLKFGRFPSLHLYSWKIGGYIQGFFFFILFAFGFAEVLYYFMIIWGILAFTEHILVQLYLKQMKSNQKGLYWVLKERKP